MRVQSASEFGHDDDDVTILHHHLLSWSVRRPLDVFVTVEQIHFPCVH